MVKTVKQYYYWCFYQSFFKMTTNSLIVLRDKLNITADNKNAVFEIKVVLRNNTLLLRPSIQELQSNINLIALEVINVSKEIYGWDLLQ